MGVGSLLPQLPRDHGAIPRQQHVHKDANGVRSLAADFARYFRRHTRRVLHLQSDDALLHAARIAPRHGLGRPPEDADPWQRHDAVMAADLICPHATRDVVNGYRCLIRHGDCGTPLRARGLPSSAEFLPYPALCERRIRYSRQTPVLVVVSQSFHAVSSLCALHDLPRRPSLRRDRDRAAWPRYADFNCLLSGP